MVGRHDVAQVAAALTATPPSSSGPLVSVILCTYNQGQFLQRAVDSVLGQTYQNLELLIIDNGSLDDTADVLEPYASDPRVWVERFETNDSVTKRLNHAVQRAQGDFISLLYADDYYLPNKLERQIDEFMRIDPAVGVVYSPGDRVNQLTGERWQPSTLDASGDVLIPLLEGLTRDRFINPIAPLVRRSCMLMHPFYEDLFVEGEANYLRIATTHSFHHLPDALVVMTDHESNIGKAFRVNGENMIVVLERLRSEAGFPRSVDAQLDLCLAKYCENLAWQALRVAADQRWARQYLRRSTRYSYKSASHPKVMVGWVLAVLPKRLLQPLNRLGFRLKPPKDNVGERAGYR